MLSFYTHLKQLSLPTRFRFLTFPHKIFGENMIKSLSIPTENPLFGSRERERTWKKIHKEATENKQNITTESFFFFFFFFRKKKYTLSLSNPVLCPLHTLRSTASISDLWSKIKRSWSLFFWTVKSRLLWSYFVPVAKYKWPHGVYRSNRIFNDVEFWVNY